MRAGSSLGFRVVALGTLWAILALVVAGGLISELYQRTAERGFNDLLTAQLYNLVSAVGVGEDGMLTGNPDLGDLRYVQPASGWYWSVVPASDNTRGELSSGSLGALEIPSVSTREIPFGTGYRRTYLVDAPSGGRLRVIETEVLLDDAGRVARFRVMADPSVVGRDVSRFNQSLFYYLGVVGLGTVIVNVILLIFALRPLAAVRRSLSAVRSGRADRLEGPFPAEILPLAREMNAMIENNRRIVERSRTQVGNLAHSLKTPIAILVNEAAAIGGAHGRVVAEQGERMKTQVQQYLDRARVAAQTDSVIYRTEVDPAVERLIRVIGKLNPHLRVERAGTTNLVFAGERQDFEEMLGNLLDNAGKWAKTRVVVRLEGIDARWFAVTVSDDGAGLGEDQRAAALERGKRFDEAKPGSGLGLSIVGDLASEYKGALGLDRASTGGLAARLTLPRAGAPETEKDA